MGIDVQCLLEVVWEIKSHGVASLCFGGFLFKLLFETQTEMSADGNFVLSRFGGLFLALVWSFVMLFATGVVFRMSLRSYLFSL